ncbi:MAG: Gfo/Idh/MocA family oxidoreductase [Clostridia bacterium]|nr:Gfo/Idh/MocA family oxidoreductase [Clostridia bacterium]
MKEKMRIAIIGCGRFCKKFVPLFKVHPVVEKVYVCDLIRERAEDFSQRFGVEIIDSFEEALASDKVNAVAIFTQRYNHGELVIRALKAGKHVYSAVPCAVKVEEIIEIEKLVRETRLTYSMGETGFYRPAAIYCRREFEKGTFGAFSYAESQYNHDIRNMEQSFCSSGGEDWKSYAGIPPFWYPTHSTSMILGAMPGVYAKRVVGMGFKGSPRTDIYGTDGQNYYANPFSNEAMLMELSNGGIARVSENRCLGWHSPETYINQFYGSEGGYEFSVARHHLSTWDPENKGKVIMKDITRELQPKAVADALDENYAEAIQKLANANGFKGTEATAPTQPTGRLPEEFKDQANGHNGTHQFMVDDFCRAYETGKLSPCNIWQAARYNIPGLMAHESALKGSIPLDVIDLGDPPADWEVLNWDEE